MNADLQRRISELSEEIRDYPRPIARCDEQLSGLIEQRARLLRDLAQASKTASATEMTSHGGCTPAATWINDGGCHAA